MAIDEVKEIPDGKAERLIAIGYVEAVTPPPEKPAKKSTQKGGDGGWHKIKKLSEVTVQDVAKALRLDEYDADWLETIRQAAVSYMVGQTGCDEEYMDNYPEFIPAMMVICQDLYDNRSYQVTSDKTNQVVDSNFIPAQEEFSMNINPGELNKKIQSSAKIPIPEMQMDIRWSP